MVLVPAAPGYVQVVCGSRWGCCGCLFEGAEPGRRVGEAEPVISIEKAVPGRSLEEAQPGNSVKEAEPGRSVLAVFRRLSVYRQLN